ncbi:hypothetical protein ACE6H2_001001 [Prunus campanulata]
MEPSNWFDSFMSKLLIDRDEKQIVWKYQGTNQLGDGALERIRMDLQTGEGLTDTDFVLASGADGSLR